MTSLFLIHSEQDAACAAQLRHDLAAQGAAIWQGTDWQQGLRDSRVVVVVWSAAAQAARVTEQIERAQWAHKRVLVVALDDTDPPAVLATAPTIRSASPCTDVAAQLRRHLPPATAEDPLLHDLLSGPLAGGAAALEVSSSAAGHIFGVRCTKGHVTYFDKRVVCRHDSSITRSIVYRDGRPRTALHLRCATCQEVVVAEVDCEGYT